ncbi:MAG: hypothetical protein ACRDKL_09630 [Solirubrobacteraceae bacterium]
MSRPSFTRSVLRRRPSAAMIVALTALFMALGGGAYAAVTIPNNSVSNAMLKKNSVGFVKMRANAIHYQNIKPGSVGVNRIDKQQIQQTLKGNCSAGNQAISAITEPGVVTCTPTRAAEFDSGPAANVTLTGTAANVALYSLNSGSSYMVQADPYVTVTPEKTGTDIEQVSVACTLSVGTASLTRNAMLETTQGGSANYASIPITMTVPSSTNSVVAHLTCTQSSTDLSSTKSQISPAVQAQGTIYALQTASNTSPTTTTTAG